MDFSDSPNSNKMHRLSFQGLSSFGGYPQRMLVFFYPEMEAMADELVQLRSSYVKGKITWSTFPDGMPNVKIDNVHDIRHNHVMFIASFRSADRWIEQIAVIYAIPRYMARSLTIVLPYFPTGTMERVETEGEIATAMSFARILSSTPNTMQGPPCLVMFDLHTLQQRFYFSDTIVPCLLTAMSLLVEMLETREDCQNISIVFPDEGAKKRFKIYFEKKFDLVVCSKTRQGSERILTCADGDPKGRHCIIVDDLVQSGGTLRMCKDLLLERGATAVSGFITHAVFPNEAWKKFINDGWDALYVTDTIPETTKLLQNTPPFKILTVAKEVDKFLYN